MKLWLIALLAVGVLALGGIVMASSGFNDTTENKETTTTNCDYAASQGGCPYQDQGCDAQNNCERDSCAAVQGTGSCGCGN